MGLEGARLRVPPRSGRDSLAIDSRIRGWDSIEAACGGARVVGVAGCDRRIHADPRGAAAGGGYTGADAAAGSAARRRHPGAAGGAGWSAGRTGSTRASGCQPQPRRVERTGSRRRARNSAGNTAGSTVTRLDPSLRRDLRRVRPSSRSSPRETWSRCPATPPALALLEKARAQLEADVALGLTFQGSYSQTKPKKPAYGGHASAMGPAPANIPSPKVRRARAGDL